jgi:hypothetical protein
MLRDAWFWIGMVMLWLGVLMIVGGELCLRAAMA